MHWKKYLNLVANVRENCENVCMYVCTVKRWWGEAAEGELWNLRGSGLICLLEDHCL